MATEYTTNRFKDRDEICRNGELVATYTAENDSIAYAGDGKKYAVPISKLVKKLKPLDLEKLEKAKEAFIDAEPPEMTEEMTIENKDELREAIIDVGLATDKTDEPTVKDIQDASKTAQLKQHLSRLQAEIEDLKSQLAGGGAVKHVPERYQGIPIDHPDAPEKDKFLGMYTPAYIEWARGFWNDEQFERIYKGKYPATEEITK